MAQLQYRSNLRPLRVLLKAGPMGALSDRQLLERFVGADGDVAELAFAAIVDRHLEGLAYEEAARLLGCPVGTVKSRLARGRERLRVRMARRGVAPSPGVLVATVSESLVPSTLRDATAHAAIRFTMHGPPAVGTVSTTAAALTEGMLKTMILFRLKIAAVVVALTGLGATAVGVLTGSVVGEQLPSAPRQTARDDVSPIPVISAIRFQGNYTISSDRINGEIATRVGQVPDNDKIKADVRNLMKTLWFSDVKTYCQEKPPDSRKYVLTFFLRELPETVPKIEYRGRKSIPLEEIEHMTALKAGQPADRVRTLLGVRQIQRLVYKIKEGGPLFSSKERVRANRGGTREN